MRQLRRTELEDGTQRALTIQLGAAIAPRGVGLGDALAVALAA